MSRFLTKDRYTCATVFVDHFSNARYVHLQRSTSVEHTLEAKRAFEHHARQNQVTIKHYHADNGTFAAKGMGTGVRRAKTRTPICPRPTHITKTARQRSGYITFRRWQDPCSSTPTNAGLRSSRRIYGCMLSGWQMTQSTQPRG